MKNESITSEWCYTAYQNGQKLFSYSESQLDNSSYDKEELEECIKNKRLYYGYDWKRSRVPKSVKLPSGTTLSEVNDSTYSKEYIEHLNSMVNKVRIKSRPQDQVYRDKFFDDLEKYCNTFTKIKAYTSKKGNVCLKNSNDQYIGSFWMGEPFFYSRNDECEVIFYHDDEKVYEQNNVEDIFYDFLEHKKIKNYQGQPITISPRSKKSTYDKNRKFFEKITRRQNESRYKK